MGEFAVSDLRSVGRSFLSGEPLVEEGLLGISGNGGTFKMEG